MNLTDLPRPFIRALLDALEPDDGRSLLFASRSILKVLSEVKPVALARWGTTAEGPTLEQLLGMSVVGALLLPDGSNDFELSPQLQLDGLKTAVLSYRYQSIFCCVSSNALHGVSDETLPHAAAAACAFTTHIIPYNSSHVVLVKQQHPNTLQPSHGDGLSLTTRNITQLPLPALLQVAKARAQSQHIRSCHEPHQHYHPRLAVGPTLWSALGHLPAALAGRGHPAAPCADPPMHTTRSSSSLEQGHAAAVAAHVYRRVSQQRFDAATGRRCATCPNPVGVWGALAALSAQ